MFIFEALNLEDGISMERLLHYVWKYGLYGSAPLTTTEGQSLAVVDPGIENQDAGPDFFNAKIRIGDTMWAGSVEIHDRASDWLRHHHDTDKAYDAVILHVVEVADVPIVRTNGERIPILVLPVPSAIRAQIDWLLSRDQSVSCLPRLREVDPIFITSWMDVLLSERLERKANDLLKLLEHYQGDWNEVLYVSMTRSFGFGVNNDAFERLARSLPYRYIQKQRISQSQVEAMLFGQAGMLRENIEKCEYYRLLQREYAFLRHKFGLQPLEESIFKQLRLRPQSFPQVKLAQLAAIWCQHDILFSKILEAKTPGEIKSFFRLQPSDFWLTHYQFNYESARSEKWIGDRARDILLINTVVPLFFAYGQSHKRPEYCDRSLRLLESIQPERNHIVSLFQQGGIGVRNAGDTQALIQLKREYCEKRKCLYCRIGFRLLKRCGGKV